jgi:hypothetical protein
LESTHEDRARLPDRARRTVEGKSAVSGIDLAEVVAKLECQGRTASIIDAGAPDMSAVPAQWAAIARSGDAEEPRLLALSRWNRLTGIRPAVIEAG